MALHAGVVTLALVLVRSEEPLPALIIDLREPLVAGSASVRPLAEEHRPAPSSRASRSRRAKTEVAAPARRSTSASSSAPPAPDSGPPPAPRPTPAVEAPPAPPPAPVVQGPPAQPPLPPAPSLEAAREPLPLPSPPAREAVEPRSSSLLAGGVVPSAPARSSGGSDVEGSGASASGAASASAKSARGGSAGLGPPGSDHGAGPREGSGRTGPDVAAVPPGGSGAGGAGAEYGPYLTALRQRIQQSLRYPASARRRGVAGTVNVEILIHPNGTIGGVTLLESSGHPVLDDAALDTIRSLPRMPLPSDLPARPLRVRVPLVFEMR